MNKAIILILVLIIFQALCKHDKYIYVSDERIEQTKKEVADNCGYVYVDCKKMGKK